jgi:DNA-binding SARP family transcriptional activator
LKAPTLDIRAIGPLEIFFAGQRLDPRRFRGPKTLYLLTYLASFSGHAVSDESVMEAMWDARSKSNLYSTCSILRKQLGSCIPGEELILRESGCLRLNPAVEVRYDIERLRQIERILKTPPLPPGAIFTLCSNALKLYRGPYLAGCPLEWAQYHRNFVDRVLVEILSRALEYAERLKDHGKVEVLADKLLEFEPTHRSANLALLRHHLGRDARKLAEERIRRYIRHYRHQLGCRPDPETMAQLGALWGGDLDEISSS